MEPVPLVPSRRSPQRCGDSALAALVTIAILLLAGPAAAATPSPFSTFLAPNVFIRSIAHDPSCNLYVLGVTADSPIPGHVSDIVMAKLDPNAAAAAYFLYLGGSNVNTPGALAVDAQGNAYITGWTGSSDFPVTSGFSGPIPSGVAAPFVLKLDPNGETVYATLFAGAVSAFPQAVAVDSAGDVIVSGYAVSG
jgi:Beta-propeller repeat